MSYLDDDTTKNDVITLIKEYLTADDGEPNDAEKVYEYFYNKGIHWLIAEMVLNIVQEDPNRINELAAELDS
jgi:uncharacterized protein (DUF2164 family)